MDRVPGRPWPMDYRERATSMVRLLISGQNLNESDNRYPTRGRGRGNSGLLRRVGAHYANGPGTNLYGPSVHVSNPGEPTTVPPASSNDPCRRRGTPLLRLGYGATVLLTSVALYVKNYKNI